MYEYSTFDVVTLNESPNVRNNLKLHKAGGV